MAQTSLPVPRAAVPAIPGAAMRGVASGMLFMAFFGTAWAGIGIGGLGGWGLPWLSLVAVLVGLTLLGGGVALLLASRRLPNEVTEADARQERRIGILFGITFATEGVLIGIASGICHAINRFDLFFPLMALIVGVHFFPLAALFHVKSHYVAGALLCLLAAFTLLAVPERATLGGQPITAWEVVPGFGAALILWSVGVKLWLLGRGLLARSERTEHAVLRQ